MEATDEKPLGPLTQAAVRIRDLHARRFKRSVICSPDHAYLAAERIYRAVWEAYEGSDGPRLTDDEFGAVQAFASMAGWDAGHAAGSWIVDGNTSEDEVQRIRKLWDDGDPAAPGPQSPLEKRGRFATDGKTIEDVLDEAFAGAMFDREGVELPHDEQNAIVDAWENAYDEGWQDEAERSVNALLPQREPGDEEDVPQHPTVGFRTRTE